MNNNDVFVKSIFFLIWFLIFWNLGLALTKRRIWGKRVVHLKDRPIKFFGLVILNCIHFALVTIIIGEVCGLRPLYWIRQI